MIVVLFICSLLLLWLCAVLFNATNLAMSTFELLEHRRRIQDNRSVEPFSGGLTSGILALFLKYYLSTSTLRVHRCCQSAARLDTSVTPTVPVYAPYHTLHHYTKTLAHGAALEIIHYTKITPPWQPIIYMHTPSMLHKLELGVNCASCNEEDEAKYY
jgi:hypothetical protein